MVSFIIHNIIVKSVKAAKSFPQKKHGDRKKSIFPVPMALVLYFEIVSVTSFAITNSGAPM